MRHLAALLVSLSVVAVGAAEIELDSGQVLEGRIVTRDGDTVLIETEAGQGVGRFRLPAKRVVAVRETDEDSDDEGLKTFGQQARVVATVPIEGVIGEQITVAGLAAAFSRAKRDGASRILLVVDSDQPGDLAEALAISDLLERERKSIQILTFIRRCRGAALVFPLHAHDIRFADGAVMGGIDRRFDDELDEIQRRDLAIRVGELARGYGKADAIFRAMIDPSQTFAAWTNAAGEVQSGAQLPSDVPADRAIIIDDANALLQLESGQLVALGLQTYPVDQLMAAFDLADWQDLGDGPSEAMRLARERQAKRASLESARLQQEADRLLSRRGSVERVLNAQMEQLEHWHPDNGQYQTIESWSRWSGRRQVETRLTPDDRREWSYRCDRSIAHIDEAIAALQMLGRVEIEADRIGLDRNHSVEEIERLARQLTDQRLWLTANRQRR